MANGARPDAESKHRPPPWLLTMLEGRAVFEFGSFYWLRLAMKSFPKGDGHPVLTLPGFLASDASTRPMRGLLNDLGYAARPWGLGRNLVFNDIREAQMLEMLESLHDEFGRKISIVGWSLGGVFARELAKQRPDIVRCVISLGSPISAPRDYSNARSIYDRLNGEPDAGMEARMARLHEPPPVPTTSVFSKSDGIVAWRGSVQPPHDDHGETENIEIPASHFGIGVNPLAMAVIADRLAQAEGEWAPFDTNGFKSLLFRTENGGR